MDEDVERAAKKKAVIERLKAKYDDREKLTEAKREVLQTWVRGLENREASQPNAAEEKQRAIVQRLARQIEEREKRKAKV